MEFCLYFMSAQIIFQPVLDFRYTGLSNFWNARSISASVYALKFITSIFVCLPQISSFHKRQILLSASNSIFKIVHFPCIVNLLFSYLSAEFGFRLITWTYFRQCFKLKYFWQSARRIFTTFLKFILFGYVQNFSNFSFFFKFYFLLWVAESQNFEIITWWMTKFLGELILIF